MKQRVIGLLIFLMIGLMLTGCTKSSKQQVETSSEMKEEDEEPDLVIQDDELCVWNDEQGEYLPVENAPEELQNGTTRFLPDYRVVWCRNNGESLWKWQEDTFVKVRDCSGGRGQTVLL